MLSRFARGTWSRIGKDRCKPQGIKRGQQRPELKLEELENRLVPTTGVFVQGTTFLDANANLQLDAADSYLPGVTVNLFNASGTTLLGTTTSDANGRFLFNDSNVVGNNLLPGNYLLKEVAPSGYASSVALASPGINQAMVQSPDTIALTLVDPSSLQITYNTDDMQSSGLYQNVDVTYYGTSYSVAAGQVPLSVSGPGLSSPKPFLSLCVDFAQFLELGNNVFNVTPEANLPSSNNPTPTFNGGEIAYLYNHFGTAPLSDGAHAAALQLAVWELEYDATPDLSSGNFVYTGSLASQAQAYIDAAAGKFETATFLSATSSVEGGLQSMIIPGSCDFGNTPFSKVTPSISTTPGGSVVIGSASKLNDSATLSGGVNPTGTITFYLFGPGVTPNANNSNNVYSDTVSVTGNGVYTTSTGTNPGGYLPNGTGTYQWVAVYNGDANNNPVSGVLGSEPEVVKPATPTITTTPSIVNHSEVYAGQFATIGFWRNQNGQAVINSFNGSSSSTQLGNWLATNFPHLFGVSNPYTGTSLAGLTNAQISTLYAGLSNGGVTQNTYLQAFANALGLYADTTSLGGASIVANGLAAQFGFVVTASGAGTFNVGSNGAAFGVPNNTSLPVFQILQIVDNNFSAATGLFYGGNQSTTSLANNVLNGINTTGDIPGNGVPPGAKGNLMDSATLAGGYNLTGTVTFYLFGPGVTPNANNSNNVYTDTVTVTGNGTFDTSTGTHPGGYAPTVTGTYQWVVVYSGDSNNSSVISPFGSEPQAVVDPLLYITADQSTIVAGQTAGYTISITNTGPGMAFNVTLDNVLPVGMGSDVNWKVDTSTTGGNFNPAAFKIAGTAGNQMLALNFNSMTEGQTISVHILGVTTANDVGTLTYTGTAYASNDLPVEPHNHDSATIKILAAPPSSVATTAKQLTHSAKYFANLVTTTYVNYLGSAPSGSVLTYWVTAMQRGLRDESLEANLIGTALYLKQHGGTAVSWVKGMYQDLLGRTPTQAELNSAVVALARGTTRTALAYAVAKSQVHETRLVTAEYQNYLGRVPSTVEIAGWVNKLQNGTASHEDVVASLLASAEFYNNHGATLAAWLAAAHEQTKA